jgi:hypothetical protein
MTEKPSRQKRRYPRIVLPKGMFVVWHRGDLQLFSRVRTLSMGGLFISFPDPEAGEKKKVPAQCSTGRTNFRWTDNSPAPKLAFSTTIAIDSRSCESSRAESRDLSFPTLTQWTPQAIAPA